MSKTPTRIYTVTCKNSGDKSLVRAISGSQAIRHVADHYTAEVASQDELVTLVADGIKVEDAMAAGVERLQAMVAGQQRPADGEQA